MENLVEVNKMKRNKLVNSKGVKLIIKVNDFTFLSSNSSYNSSEL